MHRYIHVRIICCMCIYLTRDAVLDHSTVYTTHNIIGSTALISCSHILCMHMYISCICMYVCCIFYVCTGMYMYMLHV